MTLNRAIEINTIHNDHNPNITDTERRQAHQLGIEALKRVKANRKGPIVVVYQPLPGETKERAQ